VNGEIDLMVGFVDFLAVATDHNARDDKAILKWEEKK